MVASKTPKKHSTKTSKKISKKMRGGAPDVTTPSEVPFIVDEPLLNDTSAGKIRYDFSCPGQEKAQQARQQFAEALKNSAHACNVKIAAVGKNGKTHENLTKDDITQDERNKIQQCANMVDELNKLDKPCMPNIKDPSAAKCMAGNAGSSQKDGKIRRYRGETPRLRNAHLGHLKGVFGNDALENELLNKFQGYDNNGATPVYNLCKTYTKPGEPVPEKTKRAQPFQTSTNQSVDALTAAHAQYMATRGNSPDIQKARSLYPTVEASAGTQYSQLGPQSMSQNPINKGLQVMYPTKGGAARSSRKTSRKGTKKTSKKSSRKSSKKSSRKTSKRSLKGGAKASKKTSKKASRKSSRKSSKKSSKKTSKRSLKGGARKTSRKSSKKVKKH